jgi:periplasmic divalent cation tolerance protein
MAVIAVLTNLPDSESAFNLARTLVERRLAACANVLSPATSFFRWEGRLEAAPEVPLLLKTTTERYPELERALRELHPYDIPEILAFEADRGLPAYLEWVEAECKPHPQDSSAP